MTDLVALLIGIAIMGSTILLLVLAPMLFLGVLVGGGALLTAYLVGMAVVMAFRER